MDWMGAIEMFSLPNDTQSIGQVLDHGVKLFILGFKDVIGLSFLANLLFLLPNLLLSNTGADVSTAHLVTGIIAFAICLPIGLIIFLSIVHRLWGIAHNDTQQISVSLKNSLSCIIAVIVASILYIMIIGLGFVLLIIPGVILSLSLFFYSYCILLEGDGIVESLKHSRQLVKNNWWRTAMIMTVASLILGGLYVLFGVVLSFTVLQDFEGFINGEVDTLWIDIGSSLIGAVSGPLFTSISVMLFYDLKMRNEGGDIQQRIDSMS